MCLTELGEPALFIGEPVRQVGRCAIGVDRQPCGGDAQRERQPVAEHRDPVRRRRVDAAIAGHPAEQVTGFAKVQYAQCVQPCTLVRDQVVQPVAAADQDQAGTRAGQKRAYLFRGPRVVQDDQHLPAMEHAAEQRGSLIERAGYLLTGDAKCAQESVQRSARRQRLLVRVVTAKVGIELALRR